MRVVRQLSAVCQTVQCARRSGTLQTIRLAHDQSTVQATILSDQKGILHYSAFSHKQPVTVIEFTMLKKINSNRIVSLLFIGMM